MRIAVVGTGYVGLVTGTCIADDRKLMESYISDDLSINDECKFSAKGFAYYGIGVAQLDSTSATE